MTEASPRCPSLASGLAAVLDGRLVLLLAATTVALALLPALALWPSLHDAFSRTLAGDHVLRNHPVFAPDDVLEFFHEKSDGIVGALRTALGAGFLGFLLQILYAGGFVEALGRDGRVSLGDFFAGAFRNFWHNLKCFVLFVIGAGVSIGLWLDGAGAAAKKLFEGAPPGMPARLLFRIGTLLVALFLFAILSLFHDFARIARRRDATVGAWRAYRNARRILSGSWPAALALFFFWLVAGGAVWLSLIAVEWGTAAVSVAAIILHTLLQIAAILVRSAVRVGAWGSYVAFADRRADRSAFAPPVPVMERAAAILEPFPPVDLIGETPLD